MFIFLLLSLTQQQLAKKEKNNVVLGIKCHSSLGLKSRHRYCPQSNLHTVPNNTFMSEN
mgnify:CR=1 FL=1